MNPHLIDHQIWYMVYGISVDNILGYIETGKFCRHRQPKIHLFDKIKKTELLTAKDKKKSKFKKKRNF